jgi:hypothetical protein
MRSDRLVLADIMEAQYYDMTGKKILPGQLLAVVDESAGEGFGGVIRIKDGELMFNETPLDDLLELTEDVIVAGWLQ